MNTNLIDLLCSVLILILVCKTGRPGMCGIPLFEWSIVYVLIISLRAFSNLGKIFFIRMDSSYLNCYMIGSFLLIDGAFLAWLIYGNMLFYSKANNCKDIAESEFLYHFTLLLLFIGYF
jgi:hypothetical protein